MANDNSTIPTAAVQNIAQPFELLPQLYAKTEPERLKLLQAIEIHASNAVYTLLTGMQSLGILLAMAADHKDNRLTLSHVHNMGWFIQALCNLLEGCVFMPENLSRIE